MTGRVLTVVVIGLGQMGRSHLRAYHNSPSYRVVGIVTRSKPNLPSDLTQYEGSLLPGLDAALALQSDVVSINTHTDTHAEYAIAAMESGAHVFVEKPLAATVKDATRVVNTAKRTGKKLVVGYILRHHPSWIQFVQHARSLGPPFVMRMNLNQKSTGEAWRIHKRIMETTSPIVDCGVHYIDAMLQISDGRPVQVRGMGVRLTEEIAADQYNYGHLQILFDDGSVGWYEAGWGPMMSETASFVKDVISPGGSVSIMVEEGKESADVNGHTRTSQIHLAPVAKDAQTLVMDSEPDHDDLCALEQEFLYQSIIQDRDLSDHGESAIRSLAVVLAADKSIRERRSVDIGED